MIESTGRHDRDQSNTANLQVDAPGFPRKHGKLHFVDLAGSERVKASLASGERLKEAQHINRCRRGREGGRFLSLLAHGFPVSVICDYRKRSVNREFAACKTLSPT